MITQLLLSSSASPPPWLELLFTGADASTTMTDTSPAARTVTPNGNAQIDTAQFKSTPSSLLVDGTGDYLSLASGASPDFGTNDFTVETWFRINGTPTDHDGIISSINAASTAGGFWLEADQQSGIKARAAVRYTDGTTESAYGTTVLAGNTWYHLAFVRIGTNFKLFLNGIEEGSWTNSKALGAPVNGLVIGRIYTDTNNFYLNGWLDNLRIYTYAKYSGTFTPV